MNLSKDEFLGPGRLNVNLSKDEFLGLGRLNVNLSKDEFSGLGRLTPIFHVLTPIYSQQVLTCG